MIQRIGVIAQDANSVGFLRGLQKRLGCNAEFIPAPSNIGRSSMLNRRQAIIAWRSFQNKGVDLIVRFTDSDGARWQDVRRNELEMFPEEARSILVCGVAVENTEHWLALDIAHIATALHVEPSTLSDRTQLTDRIKSAIASMPSGGLDSSERVATIVSNTQPSIFKKWLADDSLRGFYQDCRAAASRVNCQTTNELEGP